MSQCELLRVEIPIPPSANALWRPRFRRTRSGRMVFAGMKRSDKYKEWISDASESLAGYPTIPPGLIEVHIEIQGGTGFRRDRDADNCIKPCVDILRHAFLLDTDTVQRMVLATARYLEPKLKKTARCWVIVKTANEEDYRC